MNDNEFSAVIDGGAAIALGVYVAVVLYNGNLNALLSNLKTDGIGYLEFLVAIYILYLLLKIKSTRPILSLFIIGAIIVALMGFARNLNSSALSDFSNGRIGLFQFVGQMFGG